MNASTSSKKKQGHNSRTERMTKSEIELGFPFMVPDLEYKFQIICLMETLRGNQIQDIQTWVNISTSDA